MKNATSITCVFACGSRETLQRAEQLARAESDLDNVFDDVAVVYPDGIETRTTIRHRLGDYFDNVQVVARQSAEFPSLVLVFQPRHGARRHWKDIMDQILESISESFEDVSIASIEKSKIG